MAARAAARVTPCWPAETRENRMRVRTIASLGLAAAMAAATFPCFAIQDDAPLVRPKQQPPKPTGATLLVLCDMACNWKLDGDPKGHIDAGASAKVKVELGQHFVDASTEDGADQLRQFVAAKSSGQIIATIDLQPVRVARLKAEQETKDKIAQEARDKAAQQEAAHLQDLRDHAAERFNQGKTLFDQKRYGEARPLWEKACDGGEMSACANLGMLYQDSKSVSQDFANARALFQQACDGGNADGCTHLGLLYQNGEGAAQDYAQARTLYQKACDAGNASGCTDLGNLYQNGLGVTQDYVQARTFFQKACDSGNMEACAGLGGLYQKGQ